MSKGQSLSKGQIVRTVHPTTAWRRLTHDETKEWYDKFHEDCRAGRDVPYDSAGEPRLAPQDKYIRLDAGVVCEITRARSRAPSGYSTISGCCEVIITHLGEKVFIKRRSVEGNW